MTGLGLKACRCARNYTMIQAPHVTLNCYHLEETATGGRPLVDTELRMLRQHHRWSQLRCDLWWWQNIWGDQEFQSTGWNVVVGITFNRFLRRICHLEFTVQVYLENREPLRECRDSELSTDWFNGFNGAAEVHTTASKCQPEWDLGDGILARKSCNHRSSVSEFRAQRQDWLCWQELGYWTLLYSSVRLVWPWWKTC